MSYKNKGTTGPIAIVTSDVDGTGNFKFVAGTDDPAIRIEAAWDYLNDLGGGTLVTKGPGETWVIESTINSQGDDVVWRSDWSLLLQLDDGVDDDVISCTHNRDTFHGLKIDGNGANQADAENSCLEMSSTHTGNKVLYCNLQHARRKNLRCVQTGSQLEVAHNYIAEARWNNFSMNTITDALVHHNWFYYTSDVHISMYDCQNIRIHDNIIERTGLGQGATDSNWGVGVETDSAHIDVYNNLFKDIDHHAYDAGNAAHTFTDLRVYGNMFLDCGTETGTQGTTIRVRNVDGLEIFDNDFYDCSINQSDGTIYVFDGNFDMVDWRIHDNKFTVSATANPTGVLRAIYVTDVGDGEICNNKIKFLDTGGTQNGIRLDNVDDVLLEGNIIYTAEDYCIYILGNSTQIHINGGQLDGGGSTGIYGVDVDDITVRNVVFKPDIGTAVDFNRASVTSPVIMGCYAKGVTLDYSVAGAAGELLRDNIALGGGWFADT